MDFNPTPSKAVHTAKNFVTCDLMGRCANQAFQVFCAIAHAKRHGLNWYIPSETMSPNTWEYYFGECNFPVFTKNMDYCLELYQESADHTFREIPYNGKSMKLHGFFQSEKYFKDARPEIEEAFSCLYTGQKFTDTVSIHVRRGDYVKYSDSFPPVTGEYLEKAISHFTMLGFTNFMVFSDDINWCKNFFAQYPENIIFDYSEGKKAIGDLKLMIACEHHIISNSTFSWVAAWLNKNPYKIVVSPSADNWFGPKAGLKSDSIIPEEWTQIKY